MPTLVGTKLDKYEMLEEVGHGGMAVVYRAHDTVLRREVAVKVLHAHLADREESRLRLQREAIAVAKLRHENILEIYDYSGTAHAESYIVTEFIHGPTLREWIDEHLDPRPAVAALLIHRICLALGHAHQGGIIHRDIKPENVMIRSEDGCLKLMDFGIAQILDNQKLTLTGQLIGSPAYMAPELVSGKPLDARTDLFSLGIMLYQLCTGQLPFSGRNPHEVLNRIADGDYPEPSTVCPLVDQDLEAIIATALATNPDDRFQTVDGFSKELERYLLEVGLEPSKAELAAYFRDAEAYVVELDQRVCAALMERAKTAAKSGQSGRAIRLLGRVLEIDAAHPEAKALLARLRTRERRTRQALTVSGIIALGGMVAAGVMLVPPQAPASVEPSALTAVPEPGLSAAQDSLRIPDEVPTPPAESDAKTPVSGTGDRAPSAERADSAFDPGGAVGADGTSRRFGSKRRGNPDAVRTPPPRMICTLKIEGVYKSSLRNLKLSLDNQEHEVTGEEMRFELSSHKAHSVSVRSLNWTGHARLDAAACAAGPVVLKVRARPAIVSFDVPADTSIQCIRGCKGNYLPEDFPQLPIETGHTRWVELVLKVREHRPVTVKQNLKPGPNRIKPTFEPL